MSASIAGRSGAIVVMGVCGCGKTTVASALAARLGVRFIEGDALHPPRNVALMAAGTPLTDEDRQGWLQTLADELAAAGPQGAVLACSALKRRYRDQLRRAAPTLRLVHLTGAPQLLAQRLQGRAGHYMPAALLPSQLQALEPPAPDECAITLDITLPSERIVDDVCRQLEVTST